MDSSEQAADDVKEDPVMSRRMWQYLLQRCSISEEMKWSEISNRLLHQLANEICHSRFSVAGEILLLMLCYDSLSDCLIV